MSLAPPAPTSSIFERTQPLTPLTTKGKPWRLRVRAGPTARSGSQTKLANDSKVSLVVTPESRRQSITRHQNIYQKQTTVSPSPPVSYNQYGIKKQTCMKRTWLAFPRQRTMICGVGLVANQSQSWIHVHRSLQTILSIALLLLRPWQALQ